MKLKKNELLELKVAGVKAIEVKLNELRLELANSLLKLKRGEEKDLRTTKTTRRSIAQLKTIITQLQLS